MNFAAKNLRNAAIATVVALGVVAVDAVAGGGGFVKNSEVGGYRVIVEGGGVEKRKEIQYDSQGREIYNSEGFNPKLLTGGGLDNSLLGDDNIDGELTLNLDPTEGIDDNGGGGGNGGSHHSGDGRDNNAERQQSGIVAKPNPATNDKQAHDDNSGGNNGDNNAKPEPKPERPRSPWARPPRTPPKPHDNGIRQAEDGSIFIDPKSSMLEQPTTEDGRKLPFYISGQKEYGKDDQTAGLTNFTKMNTTYMEDKRSIESREIETTDRYNNIIGLEEWHAKFSPLGGRRTDRYDTESNFSGREFRVDKNFETKILENNLMWAHTQESHISTDSRFAHELAEKYSNVRTSNFSDARLPAPGQLGGISMQTINRYQFRRSHSTEAGLETVTPGNSETHKISDH